MTHPSFCTCELCTAGPMSKSRQKRIDTLDTSLEAVRKRVVELEHQVNSYKDERDELRSLHDAGIKEAYRICGVEDDGEYRWKWVLLELSNLVDKVKKLEGELQKWNAPCDDENLEATRKQSEDNSLAAKQAYINGLEHRVKRLEKEALILKVDRANLEAENKRLREGIDNISQRMYDGDMGEQLAILELKALANIKEGRHGQDDTY